MKMYNFSLLFSIILGVFLLSSCGDDEVTTTPVLADPISSFQFEIDADDFTAVTFSNFSQNSDTYSWDFGDSNTSIEENPTHMYGAAGSYTVVLTATSDAGSATSEKTIEITNPNEALTLLAGNDTKTWKLYREGVCLSLGPDAENPALWWPGLTNNGARPCVFEQTFTFGVDGSFVFDDNGVFWGENDPWAGTALHETCFESTDANMVNLDGADVSAWGSGTHQFDYDPTTGNVTLTGMGAWMGLVQTVGLPDLYSNAPTASRTFRVSIAEETGVDIMTISYDYGADGLWTCVYASYSDASLEPAIETTTMAFGEDLEDVTPTAMFNTMAAADATNVQELAPTASEVVLTVGVDDPADASAAKVGEYVRGTGAFADLKFQLDYDCQFDNFTTLSIDAFFPSTNDYSGALTPTLQMWIADASQTQEFWTNWVDFNADPMDIVIDEWKTYSFPLGDALTRTDLDLLGLVLGGSNHSVDGTFYVRNLVIN